MTFHARRRGLDPIALFLGLQLAQRVEQLPVKPPVTLGLMALMALLFFAPHDFAAFGVPATLEEAAFVPRLVYEYGEWHRIWTSCLVHVTSTHLMYNLGSLLLKGAALESVLGSERFVAVTAVVALTTQLIFLALSMFDRRAYETATVGFSGVLFAFKVLLSRVDEGGRGLAGFFRLDVPWDQIIWIELLWSYLLTPGSSLLGHLSGIVAGAVLKSYVFAPNHAPPPRFWGFGFGGGSGDVLPPSSPPSTRTTAFEESLPFPSRAAPSVASLSAEELRRRRLDRFG